MEYSFGTARRGGRDIEYLKTKGGNGGLSGFLEVRQEHPDSVVTDRCRIKERYFTDFDSEGSRYDVYEIAAHYRYIDKTEPLRAAQSDGDALAVDHEYRLALLELGVI